MAAAGLGPKADFVPRPRGRLVVHIGPEGETLAGPLSRGRHLNRNQGLALDRDGHLLHGRHEIEAILFAAQHGGE